LTARNFDDREGAALKHELVALVQAAGRYTLHQLPRNIAGVALAIDSQGHEKPAALLGDNRDQRAFRKIREQPVVRTLNVLMRPGTESRASAGDSSCPREGHRASMATWDWSGTTRVLSLRPGTVPHTDTRSEEDIVGEALANPQRLLEKI
jgi:hypothetical protein